MRWFGGVSLKKKMRSSRSPYYKRILERLDRERRKLIKRVHALFVAIRHPSNVVFDVQSFRKVNLDLIKINCLV